MWIFCCVFVLFLFVLTDKELVSNQKPVLKRHNFISFGGVIETNGEKKQDCVKLYF